MPSETLTPPGRPPIGATTDGEPPLWSRFVVTSSIAALGAATGIAAYHHVALAPWLATVVGTATAVALYGLHRAWTTPLAPSNPKPRPRKPQPVASPTVHERTPVLPSGAPAAAQPPAPARAASQASASVVIRDPVATPSRSTPPAVGKVEPQLPSSLKGMAPPQLTDAAFDAQVRQLQNLVREMSRETTGPRARTPDPDGLSRFAKPSATPAAGPTMTSPEVDAGPPQAPPVQTGFGAPAAADMPRATSRAAAQDSPAARRVAEAVAAERVDVLLETIQNLQEGRPRHFEISVRFRDSDNLDIQPDELADIARRNGLAARIDALKLPRIARVARRVQQRGGQPADVLSDVAGPSLTDHGFMAAFAELNTESTPPPVVLSFSQADVRDFARIHWTAVATLADMGFRFALTDVTDVDMDLDLLRARGFSFVKLDAEVFLGGLPHATGVIPSREICRHFEQAGLAVIVAAVKSENDLAALRANGVGYAQGAFFGGPRKVRADILTAAA